MKLERNLQHQVDAVESIVSVFEGINFTAGDSQYSNPVVDWKDDTDTLNRLKLNISNKQASNKIPDNMRTNSGVETTDEYLNIDIKMETGTGKTFVQVQTIFELNKKYGFNKFIIIVPSLPIKRGTQNFISSTDTKRFFADEYNDAEIDLSVVESTTTSKGKNSTYFPRSIREFVAATTVSTKKIQVMLLNMQLLKKSKKGQSSFLEKRYDTTILDEFAVPSEAIKAVKPIVLIDEPHRFSTENVTFDRIVQLFAPQCIIRYGATFPTRKGPRRREIVKDYRNLVYNLDSVEAFNRNLVKGVSGEFVPAGQSGNDKVVELMSVKSKESCRIRVIEGNNSYTKELKRGDSLSANLDDAFGDIEISEITSKSIVLSNGLEVLRGTKLSPECFSETYQERMICVALKRHFVTEEENFKKDIKTLALFFIDDISSFREIDDKEPYVLNSFDKIFREQLNQKISDPEIDCEYKRYLEESLNNISGCRAAYFARDKETSNENIKEEMDDILNNKEKILRIKNDDGTFNLRRFIFSKWTLKEGWDNPNIFTIAKLRSSGSENSKLQEVGRGLRLPVDTNLNRLSREKYYLNYIVDFTEKDFVNQLVGEINSDRPAITVLTQNMIDEIAAELNKSSDDVFILLVSEKIIGSENKLLNSEKLKTLCPNFYHNRFEGLHPGIVVSQKDEANIRVRVDNFNRIEPLWKAINKRYLISFDQIHDDEIEAAILDILKDISFHNDQLITVRQRIAIRNGQAQAVNEGGLALPIHTALKYNDFIKRLSEATHIPIVNLHNAFVSYSGGKMISEESFNGALLSELTIKINTWRARKLCGRFQYKSLDMPFVDSIFRDGDKVKETIVLGNVGTEVLNGEIPQASYLYDAIAYDSEIERRDIQTEVAEVVVFGKIPRNSVKIPVINGGTYSPDFMYLVKKSDGSQELNLVIESKGDEAVEDLREIEQFRIKCAEKFFEQISKDSGDIDITYKLQMNSDELSAIIRDLLER